MIAAKDGSISDRALVDPDRNNFGPRARLRLHADRRRPSCAAAGASATSTSTASARPTCSASTDRRSCARSVNQSDRHGRDLPADRAGLSGRPDRSVAVQPADRAHQLHPERLPLEPGAELVRVGAARVRPAHAGRRRLCRQQGGRPAAGRQLQPGGGEQRGRDDRARGAAADSDLRRHHLRLQRRQVALRRASR